jgi:hypothetical protein
MIDDLDEALRKLLMRELPIKKNEIDIAFNQPKREWSARLSRPTLNLFLYDIRENVKLRQTTHTWSADPHNGNNAVQRRKPRRVDLKYLLTAWATEPDDEHRLLARVLMVLFRFPELPEDILPEILLGQPAPIAVEVAHPDGLPNPSDFWSAMDNEIRPALLCTVTLALDPYKPLTTSIVRERELRFLDADTGEVEGTGRILWTVKGAVRGAPPMRPVRMTLVEKELQVPVEHDGAFGIKGIAEGDYTLRVSVADGEPSDHKFTVPSKEYVIEL